MEEIKAQIERLSAEVEKAAKKIGLDELMGELDSLRAQMHLPDFWQDQKKAGRISKQEAALAARVEPWAHLRSELAELVELVATGDESLSSEINSQLEKAGQEFAELKKQLRFNGPYDDHEVLLAFFAGAGGTDAQDWTQMLVRMYTRWAANCGLKVRMLTESPGEEAGVKSATIEITGGQFLYGKLSGEYGVHRLVRLSPFNADHLRQTSFARVEVMPLMSAPEDVELDDKDLKIETFRAGGHGGQSVNTTDSAVRVTHTPTGISVSIQNERSQLQNRQTALAILRSKLTQLQLEQHAENIAKVKGPTKSAEWGNQIRSYVLHPYKQVKDLRSGYQTSEAEKVLDGDLDPLIDAWLDTKH